MLQAFYKPFENKTLDRFEFLSLIVSSMTFFFGVFTLSSETEAGRNIASALSVIINLAYFLVAIKVGLNARKEDERIKAAVNRVPKVPEAHDDIKQNDSVNSPASIELVSVAITRVPAPTEVSQPESSDHEIS